VAEAEDFNALVRASIAAFCDGHTQTEYENLRSRAEPFQALSYDLLLSTYAEVCADLLTHQCALGVQANQDGIHRFLLWFCDLLFGLEQQVDCLHSIGVYFLVNEQPAFSHVALRRAWRLRHAMCGRDAGLSDLYLQLAVAGDEVGRVRRVSTLLKAAALYAAPNKAMARTADMALRLQAYCLAMQNHALSALTLLTSAEAFVDGIYQATPLQVHLGWTMAICSSAFRTSSDPRPKLLWVTVRALNDIAEKKNPAERLVEFDGLVHTLDRTRFGSLGAISMAATIRIVDETDGHKLSRQDRIIIKNNLGNALLTEESNEAARSVFQRVIKATPRKWLKDPDVLYQLAHAQAGIGYSYYNEGKSIGGPLAREVFESAAQAFGEARKLLHQSGRAQFHDARIWACSGITHVYLGEVDKAHEDFARALLVGNGNKPFKLEKIETLVGFNYDTPLKYAEALRIVGAGYTAALFAKLAVASVHRLSLPAVCGDGLAQEFVESRSFAHRTLIDLLTAIGRFNEAEQASDLLLLTTHECLTHRSLPQAAVAGLVALTSIEHQALRSVGLSVSDTESPFGRGKVANLARAFAAMESALRSGFEEPGAEPVESDLAQKLGADLPDGSALLRYVVTDTALIISIVHGRSYHNRRVAARRAEVNTLAFEFRRYCRMQPIEGMREIINTAGQLYDLLIRPVLEELGQLPPVLYLELDSPLNSVPFAALFNCGHYLCESTTVLYFHRNMLERPISAQRMASQHGSRAAVFASDGGLTIPLQGAEKEANLVRASLLEQRRFDEVSPYIGNDCTANALLLELTNRKDGCGLIHLASHATFNATSEALSALLLSDRSLSFQEIRKHIETNGCSPVLVVLSACGTARVDVDVEGFTVILLRNGVRSVVSTLWESIDASAPTFFYHMYSIEFELASAQSIASAMRSATLAMLEASEDSDFSWLAHPANWAPYIITTTAMS